MKFLVRMAGGGDGVIGDVVEADEYDIVDGLLLFRKDDRIVYVAGRVISVKPVEGR